MIYNALLTTILLSLFKFSRSRKHNVFILNTTSRIFSFFCVMYYIVLEICVGGSFLEDCFYCYSQQIISAVGSEYLIPNNLVKRAPETQNLQYCKTKCQPKPNQRNVKYSSVFRTKDFVPHK